MLGNVSVFDLRRVKIVKIIDDRDVPYVFADQLVDKMRANESGAAGN